MLNGTDKSKQRIENSTVLLSEAFNEAELKDLAEETEKLIEKTNTEMEKFSKDYLDFKNITAKMKG